MVGEPANNVLECEGGVHRRVKHQERRGRGRVLTIDRYWSHLCLSMQQAIQFIKINFSISITKPERGLTLTATPPTHPHTQHTSCGDQPQRRTGYLRIKDQ